MAAKVGDNPLAKFVFKKKDAPKGPDYTRGGFAFEDVSGDGSPHPATSEVTMATAGFISPTNYSGPQIVEAELPHPDIAQGDVVYLNIGAASGVNAGSAYEIIRQRRPVFRPGTYEKMGVLMMAVGRLQVVCVQQDTAIAIVTKAFTDIVRGDFVIPYNNREAPMTTGSPETDACQPARGEVRGIILDSAKGGYRTSDGTILGTGDVVYLDVGQKQNVTPGQYFVVFRKSRLGDKYPVIQVGELIVLAAEQETATALITAVRQDISLGYTVQLK